MATRMNPTTTLKITRVTSTNTNGKDQFDYVNLTVNPELSDDDLLSIGGKLSDLQAFPVRSIGRIDASALAE